MQSSRDTLDAAAQCGYFELAQWLIEGGKGHVKVNSDNVLNCAAHGGHLELVEWLFKNRHGTISTKTVECAAKYGHLNVVKWLWSMSKFGSDTAHIAAQNAPLEVVEYLMGQCQLFPTVLMLQSAAEEGRLGIIQWLARKEFRSGYYNEWLCAIDRAAYKGHLHVVQFMVAECFMEKDVWNAILNAALNGAARGGHLKIVQRFGR